MIPGGTQAARLKDKNNYFNEAMKPLHGPLPKERQLPVWVAIPAYDLRPDFPNEPNYGIHGVELIVAIRGPEGVLQLRWMTNWFLKQNRKSKLEFDGLGDISTHQVQPLSEYDYTHENCEFVCGTCYSQSGALVAGEAWEEMVRGGSPALYKFLNNLYDSWMFK